MYIEHFLSQTNHIVGVRLLFTLLHLADTDFQQISQQIRNAKC